MEAYCKHQEQSVKVKWRKRNSVGGDCKLGLDTTQKRSKLVRILNQNPLHTSATPTALTELLEIYQIVKKNKTSAQPVRRA